MSDDTDPPLPPPVSPYAFLRKPIFIFGTLFLAWIFVGQAAIHLLPHRDDPNKIVPVTREVSPAKPEATPPVAQETIKEKDTQIADLQHRLDDLETKVKVLQDSAASPPKPYDDSALTAKIDGLQTNLDALKQERSTQVGDAAHIEEVLHKQEEDITALKTQLADTQAKALRRLSLMAAFGTLKDAIMRGESFAEPLRQMNDLAKDDVALLTLLVQLTPYAGENATTLADLQSQFEAAVPQALAPDNSNNLMSHLHSLIRIRKVGEQPGNSDEAIVARAETKLNHGDIKGSLDELAELSPAATNVFAGWMKKAQAYLSIRDTLAAMQPALLQPPAAAQ